MIVIITARKGSKRCPEKNIVTFGDDRNLIDIAIADAYCLKPEAIIITTDYEAHEILNEKTKQFGAIYYSRPEELCGDDVSSEDVVKDAIRNYIINFRNRVPIKEFCLLQPTSPMRSNITLVMAQESFRQNNLPALVSVNPANQPNGCFYFCLWEAFLMEHSLYPLGHGIWKCDWNESTDINYFHEFRIAQAVYNAKVYGL